MPETSVSSIDEYNDASDVKELVQQLQVHKIELEMQNEELKSAQHELEKSRNKYLSLFDMAPVGFFTLNNVGIILEANEKGLGLLGITARKATNRRFSEFVVPEHIPVFYSFFSGLRNNVGKNVSEIQLLNTSRFVQMEGVLFNDKDDNSFTVQLAIIDVTLRKEEEERYAHQKLLQQKQILNTILQTQEDERSRIAEALHNGLGQLLYATKLKLEDVKENKSVKTEIAGLLDQAISETRNLSFLLMPALLKDFGLKVILDEVARRFSTKTFKLECDVIGVKKRLSNDRETDIFRIIQELLNNVLKHSGASKAHILVKKGRDKIEIVVKDNGFGFETDKASVKGSGLKSIYNRLELMGGSMKIQSKCGKGTTVTVSV
ncbi:MAG: domain S-box protein [Bacteroidota bacterium]|nr:domain S-box protein [Bacteroidota bacterium]